MEGESTMDDIMNDVDRLFAMAVKTEKAPSLDSSEVMRRIAMVSNAAPAFEPPIRLFIGIGSIAAVLAIVAIGLAATTWSALHDPIQVIQTLPDILNLLKI